MSEGTYTYAFHEVSHPNYAIQINSGHYIVSDYGNNRIIELDSTLSSIVKAYSINGAVFFDYSENNETLLITSASLNIIREITWSNVDYGTTIWESTCTLLSPQCATYKQDDVSKIVIADMGNNRIVKYSRNTDDYEFIYYYNVGDSNIHEMSSFYYPYRVYQYENGNICIIEREGRQIDFTTIESSSSESSSSSLYGFCEYYTYEGGEPFYSTDGEYCFSGYYNGRPYYYNAVKDRYMFYYIPTGGYVIYDELTGAGRAWLINKKTDIENPEGRYQYFNFMFGWLDDGYAYCSDMSSSSSSM